MSEYYRHLGIFGPMKSIKNFPLFVRSEDGEFLGCVTDTLPDKRNITVPMYAKLCSAICYIRDEDTRKQVNTSISVFPWNQKCKVFLQLDHSDISNGKMHFDVQKINDISS